MPEIRSTNPISGWDKLSKEDCAAWGVGSVRSHLLQFCDSLEEYGAEGITVEGLRKYLHTLEIQIVTPGAAEADEIPGPESLQRASRQIAVLAKALVAAGVSPELVMAMIVEVR